mmetsp:Transcript_41351/g.67061  ORF Transcript_41351/g.67061 Transcript_41351/m.67061 type:complete len:301 (+) Transcript_41351:1457-2359(+)
MPCLAAATSLVTTIGPPPASSVPSFDCDCRGSIPALTFPSHDSHQHRTSLQKRTGPTSSDASILPGSFVTSALGWDSIPAFKNLTQDSHKRLTFVGKSAGTVGNHFHSLEKRGWPVRARRAGYCTDSTSPGQLSHIDDSSNMPRMVDVADKRITKRTARAQCRVLLPPVVAKCLQGGEIQAAKGPVFATAIVAGTMAVKRTSDLIPFCHPISVESCKISMSTAQAGEMGTEVVIECTVGVHHKTGVEMEALVGCTVAALTVYDMCKAMSHHIVIREARLMEKTGGKSDIKHGTIGLDRLE